MRFLIAKHRDLYAAHIADAILGVEVSDLKRSHVMYRVSAMMR